VDGTLARAINAGNSHALLDSAAIRVIEQSCPGIDLMRRAGKAAARFLIERTTTDSRVVLFAGPGNNGGDAFACAVELAAAGYAPAVCMLGDPARLPADAMAAWQRMSAVAADDARTRGGAIRIVMGYDGRPLEADWIVDGLFGIGLRRPLDGAFVTAVAAIAAARERGACVLALDVPSGIDTDSGALVGACAVAADHTISFIACKPGLVTGPALDHVGEVHLASLGLPELPRGATSTFGLVDARARLRRPRANAHKGTHGTLCIVGGADGMLGAALLASRAAMRMGTGKVRVAWLAQPYPQVDPQMPEVMMGSARTQGSTAGSSALVVGCGLGRSDEARRVLADVLPSDLPLLLDADALNLIAESGELRLQVARRAAATVITPHPAEAARLLGSTTAAVQNARLHSARALASDLHCIAVVKGAGTVVDDGTTATVNTTGNPLLATAGTGDVLAGMIGALLAQGLAAADAARAGVALHGAVADALAARGTRRAVASDIIAGIGAL